MIRPESMDVPREDDFGTWLDLLGVEPSAELLDRIARFLRDYLQTHALSCYVLGVSGGIDSGFLAALMHARSIPFVPFSLVIEGNTPEEAARAQAIIRAYGPDAHSMDHTLDLTSLYKAVSSMCESVFQRTTRIAEGNLKARCRMVFLYHAAQLVRGCVLSTDQLDELLTGFWTLHGDVGDVSPLQLIPKTTEYQLAGLLCAELDDPAPLEAAMAATPTDGLGISSSDLDQLGVSSYKEVEEIFREYFSLQNRRTQGIPMPDDGERLAALQQLTVVRRFESTSFKRQGPVVLNPL
ncbi:NAD(+) synthase [Desulfoplanes formicivorans]|uniref:NH(3)-dependent NAD(+) synthetase n=1 Tax=Desulfoplanes formicivorans TaxID=1592317 RepID=A0A194AKS1_9BACT|nr:NAD(+) synthase [Desulfoplanes formicivorans]GAU09840.1 NAD+ synthetase [Desulfoplanes formicivorans]